MIFALPPLPLPPPAIIRPDRSRKSVLPGTLPFFFAGNRPSSLSMVGSSTSQNATTITAPAGILAGDLLVFGDTSFNDSTTVPTYVSPVGFTVVSDTFGTTGAGGGQAVRNTLSYKIANGTESSTAITGMSSGAERMMLYVFRGDHPITSVISGGVSQEAAEGNPASQNVTASSAAAPLVVLGLYRSQGAVDPRSFSPAKDGEISPTAGAYLAYKIYNSAPANVAIDMDDEGNINALISCYLSCS